MTYSSSILSRFIAIICIISIASCCRCPQHPSIHQTTTPTPYYEYDNNYQYYAPPSYHNNAPGNYYDYDSNYQGYQYIPSVPDSAPFDYPVAR